MLSGLQKAKAVKELRQLRLDKNNLKGLSLAKAVKRMKEIRLELGLSVATSALYKETQALLTKFTQSTWQYLDVDDVAITDLFNRVNDSQDTKASDNMSKMIAIFKQAVLQASRLALGVTNE